jgi:thymidylate kinase
MEKNNKMKKIYDFIKKRKGIVKSESSFDNNKDFDLYIRKRELPVLKQTLKTIKGKEIYNLCNKEVIFSLPIKETPYIKRLHVQVDGTYVKGNKIIDFETLNKNSEKKKGFYILNKKYYKIIKKEKKKNKINVKKLFTNIRYFLKRKSLIIAFIGIDGAGKSTMLRELEKNLKVNFRVKRIYMGWSDFTIFSRLIYKIIPKKEKKTKEKKTKEKKNNKFKLTFYYIELWIRFLILMPDMILGKTILLDRYFYDELYNYDKKSLTYKFFNSITPKITKTFFLDVTPEKSYQRKKEHGIEILRKERKKYLENIKTNNSIELVPDNYSIQEKSEYIFNLIKKELLEKKEIINP